MGWQEKVQEDGDRRLEGVAKDSRGGARTHSAGGETWSHAPRPDKATPLPRPNHQANTHTSSNGTVPNAAAVELPRPGTHEGVVPTDMPEQNLDAASQPVSVSGFGPMEALQPQVDVRTHTPEPRVSDSPLYRTHSSFRPSSRNLQVTLSPLLPREKRG